jgi:hypothetical protein
MPLSKDLRKYLHSLFRIFYGNYLIFIFRIRRETVSPETLYPVFIYKQQLTKFLVPDPNPVLGVLKSRSRNTAKTNSW